MTLSDFFAMGPWESPLRLVMSVLVLALSALLQATIGFAAGVLGIPLLLWAGNSLPESQTMIITAMLPQNLFGLWRLRKSVSLGEVWLPAAIRVSFLPLGILGLSTVMVSAPKLVDQIIGILILMAVLSQWVRGDNWRTAGKWYWMVPTFGLSGTLQGLSGMSAPPMVLWLQGQRTPADKSRAFLFTMYLSSFLPQLVLMLWGFGPTLVSCALLSVATIPVVMLSAAVGLRLGSWLGDERLRPIIYVLLIWMAIVSLITPWFSVSTTVR